MQDHFTRAMRVLDRIHKEGFGKYRPREPGNGILRPRQLEALRKIIFSIYSQNKDYVVLTAPTGAGKSVIAAVLAKIMLEVSGSATNLTTSSRALQRQYGEDLVFDPDFKVVMGNSNYRCSFFQDFDKKDSMLKQALVGKSPCQDEDNPMVKHWPFRKLATFRSEEEIHTLHEDQDKDVLEQAKHLETVVDAQYNSSIKVRDGSAGALKKACQDTNACSYYNARAVADKAPVAIRSLQHLMFYILYNVQDSSGPILPQRTVHIHDECHNIEATFREFFSSRFSEKYYKEVMEGADTRDKVSKAADPVEITEHFEVLKKDKGNRWSNEDKERLSHHLQRQIGEAIEKLVIPQENFLRQQEGTSRIRNAGDFLRASVNGEIFMDVESIHTDKKTLLKWYKNLHHATTDSKHAHEAKAQGFKHKRRYSAAVSREKGQNYFTVFPLTLEGMAERYFGKESTLFMSATPQPPQIFEKMFGIEKKVAYVEIDSDFPPERSPIFWDPVETVTLERARTLGEPALEGQAFKNQFEKETAEIKAGWEIIHANLAGKIREIVQFNPSAPGIIPCTSYTMVQALKENLEDLDQFIWAIDGEDNKKYVKQFKDRASHGEPVILVSAGISEGHSFNDDISRIQILPKMPFAVRDSMMEDLCERWGQGYYTARTSTVLQQMVGRSMRSKSDYCTTIVLDKKFEVLKNEKLHKFYSRHFLKCLRWGEDWRTFSFPQD